MLNNINNNNNNNNKPDIDRLVQVVIKHFKRIVDPLVDPCHQDLWYQRRGKVRLKITNKYIYIINNETFDREMCFE